MRKKRDRKEQMADQKKYYDGLEEKTDEKAREWFNTPSYNKPQRSENVEEYVRRLHGKGSDADGRSDDKRTSGVISEQ